MKNLKIKINTKLKDKKQKVVVKSKKYVLD